MKNVLSKTSSICPKCQAIIGATIFEKNGKVFIEKSCKKHGKFSDLYYGSYEMYKKAERFACDGKGVENPNVTKESPICPKDCGLCNMHKSHTALANIAVTNRCDLNCWYCFFYAGRVGYVYEPTLEQIDKMVGMLANEKPVACNAVQLTGGEPCIRNDLVDIVKIVKKHGIDHIQLNTNGIILGKNLELTKNIRQAGINTLYLSFDGVSPKTNPKNHWEIPQIFDTARQAGVGIVLVPTIINSINDHEIGSIVKFGFKHSDIVRSVNLQPVSLVGRMPKSDLKKYRITIPDVIQRLEEQTNGEISKDDFYPVPTVSAITDFVEAMTGESSYHLSSHFACGMGTYVFNDNGKMIPITRFVDVEGLMEYLNSVSVKLRNGKNKYIASLKLLWKIGSFIDEDKQPDGFNIGKIIYNALTKHDYRSLGAFHSKSMFIGMMHFMDQWNYDIERVKRCCIHYAMTDGRIIPFCAFNVIPEWYRDKSQKAQGISIRKWEKENNVRLKDILYKRNVKELEASPLYQQTYEGFVNQTKN
ncbi:MAG: tetraether lipid synthase Tes [Candidatus Aenigmatarchaeota archaeon]